MNLSRSQNTGIAGATSSVWSFFSSNLFYALLTLVFVVLIYLYWHYIGYQVSASYTTLVDMISTKKEGSVGLDLTGSGSPSVGATATLPNADGSSDSGTADDVMLIDLLLILVACQPSWPPDTLRRVIVVRRR
jgi:zona occludens toxin (predicted ATPase)